MPRNLDVLREEYLQAKPQLEQAVSRAAERRKAEIAAEGQRDHSPADPSIGWQIGLSKPMGTALGGCFSGAV